MASLPLGHYCESDTRVLLKTPALVEETFGDFKESKCEVSVASPREVRGMKSHLSFSSNEIFKVLVVESCGICIELRITDGAHWTAPGGLSLIALRNRFF